MLEQDLVVGSDVLSGSNFLGLREKLFDYDGDDCAASTVCVIVPLCEPPDGFDRILAPSSSEPDGLIGMARLIRCRTGDQAIIVNYRIHLVWIRHVERWSGVQYCGNLDEVAALSQDAVSNPPDVRTNQYKLEDGLSPVREHPHQ